MNNYVLIISFLISLIIPGILLDIIDPNYKYEAMEILFNVAIFFPFIFVFSLITYFSPEMVFASWWKFARIAIPVIFALVLVINLELHHSPVGEMQDIFDVPALVLLYSIFILGSAWQIWKGWKSK